MRKKIVLKNNGEYNLVMIPATKQLCEQVEANLELYNHNCKIRKFESIKTMDEELIAELGFKYKDIVELGDTEVSNQYANSRIEKLYIRSTPKETTNAYKCHCTSDWKFQATHKNLILHEDGLSSWNCAMDILGHPKYAIIIQEKVMTEQ